MKNIRINNQIRAREVRVVDGITNENLGVLSIEDALRRAQESGGDLIEIAADATPPVCRIMDFGKWQYLEKKKDKENKKKSHSTETKSLQIKIGTGENDLKLKADRTSEWLKEGHRVKIELYLVGRSKYSEDSFKEERLNRILAFISTPYKVAETPKKSPKGIMIVLEREAKAAKKDTKTTTENEESKELTSE